MLCQDKVHQPFFVSWNWFPVQKVTLCNFIKLADHWLRYGIEISSLFHCIQECVVFTLSLTWAKILAQMKWKRWQTMEPTNNQLDFGHKVFVFVKDLDVSQKLVVDLYFLRLTPPCRPNQLSSTSFLNFPSHHHRPAACQVSNNSFQSTFQAFPKVTSLSTVGVKWTLYWERYDL